MLQMLKGAPTDPAGAEQAEKPEKPVKPEKLEKPEKQEKLSKKGLGSKAVDMCMLIDFISE